MVGRNRGSFFGMVKFGNRFEGGRMIVEIQGSVSYFTSKLSTCLLVVIIYPIHIKKIGVVQWYVLCPILSFFCVIIIYTYVFKHGCACLKLEFGRFQIFQ
jgi:hypothetical protein